jgi:hypothetical protein
LAEEKQGCARPSQSVVGAGFEDGMIDRFAVSLYVTDANADRRIRDWLDAGQRTGKFTELRGIPGARRLARIDGLRLSPR